MTKLRTGQAPKPLNRKEFTIKFYRSFVDPTFAPAKEGLRSIESIAWTNYVDGHKAPFTEAAGEGFANPDYELSVEWKATGDALIKAQAIQQKSSTKSRVLLICGSARNDGTCPSEMSKTFRMVKIAEKALNAQGIETDILDLSLLTSDYDLHIHPCKACASTAMPLCHWPCSCYPNHGQRQTNDWMADIYEQWVAAHAVIIFTPVYWYQTPSVLKLMIDRLVCADGGNPDPTTTDGKDAKMAKALELKGWPYPKHLAGRAYGLVVHGDVAGIEGVRRGLSDWLDWMGLIDSGAQSRLDRFVGYYESYAKSHEVMDKDIAFQQEVTTVALAVANAVKQLRAGKLIPPDAALEKPRKK